MRLIRFFAFLMAWQAALSVVGGRAFAEPPLESPVSRDAPSRAARLSFMEGAVSFRAAGVDAWADGTLNRPVTVNDRIWADTDSRAEIHLGSSAIRLSGRTSVAVTNLDQQTLQLSVSEGTVGVRVRELAPHALVEVDTPTAAVTLRHPGAYRIFVDPSGTSVQVVVRLGNAEVLADGEAFEVVNHDMATVVGEAGQTSHTLAQQPAADGFDAWCDARDQREDNPPALRYVSRDTVGYEDLDAYGTWQQTPEYGPVWAPQDVGDDWAPYQNGRWSWVDPWGWTWIDAAAWGYAPFHYGRWVTRGGRWCWAPGPIVSYPTYAPALVGFIGAYGYGWGSYRDPLVGWFPLGWHEPYVPNYYASYNYVRQLNMNYDIRNIDLKHIHQTQTYLNRGIPGAVTVVPRNVMQGAQPTLGQRVSLAPGTLNQSPVIGFTAHVAPHISSVVGAQNAHARAPDAAALRPTTSHLPPAPATVPFARREPALQHSYGRPMINDFRGTQPYAPGPRPIMAPRPTQPTPYSHPVAPVSHGGQPVVIGPHPAPPWYGPRVHNVQQPPREQVPQQAPNIYRVPQPPRYEPPAGTWNPRYNAPVPHYNAPAGGIPGYRAPGFAPNAFHPNAPAPHFAPAEPHTAPMPMPHFPTGIRPGGHR